MNLKPRDLLELVKVCSESGVSEISLQDIRIVFGPKTRVQEQQEIIEAQETLREAAEVERKYIDKSEQELREEQLALLLLEDPAEFERLEALGELDGEQPEQTND